MKILFILLLLPLLAKADFVSSICRQSCDDDTGSVAFSLMNNICPSKAQFNYTCSPYRCRKDAPTCATKCVDNRDCSNGAICEQGKCYYPKYYCRSDSKLVDYHGAIKDCAPFTCKMGACLETCLDDGDCALNYRCDRGSFQCVR